MSNDVDFRERIWRTADGRGIPIKDMQLGHLVNVINWIADNETSYPEGLLENYFVREAHYRQLISFAEGKPYPGLVDGRWMVIDPHTGSASIQKPPADYIDAVKDNSVYQSMYRSTQEKRRKRST